MPGSAAALSVTQLSAFHEGVQRLRAQLRAAFVEDGPRLEMPLYKTLCDILTRHVRPFLLLDEAAQSRGGDCDADATAKAAASGIDGGLVLTYYLQDIFATLLFLLDDAHDRGGKAAPLVELPSVASLTSSTADGAASASEHYVSHAQRRYCTRWFFYLCHGGGAGGRRAVPVHHVLQSLYPLLDTSSTPPAATASHETTTALENHVVVNMLREARFASRRAFLAATLHGLVLSSAHGVRALVRVFLLDDRVGASGMAEATEYVVRLLTNTTSAGQLAWMADTSCGAPRRVVLRRVETEEQMRCIGAQLVDLLAEHTEEATTRTATSSGATPLPSFLQTLAQHSRHASQPLLPQETLEERLHYFVARLCNAMVQLPSPDTHASKTASGAAFQLSYRRLFYFNKHCLTPAFAPLSLRAGGAVALAPEQMPHLLQALWRVNAVLHGAALHAAAQGAVLVLEAVAPGLLSLYALPPAHMPAPLRLALDRLRRLLLHEGAVPPVTLAQVLVQGCTMTAAGAAKYRFVADNNAVEPAVRLVRQPCAASVRLQGLLRLVFDLPGVDGEAGDAARRDGAPATAAPAELQAATFDALVNVCSAQVVRRASVEAVLPRVSQEQKGDEHDELDVMSALRAVCMAASADALFGTRPTLMSFVTLLRRVACLSPWFLRWAATLTPKVLSLLPPPSSSPHTQPCGEGSGRGGTQLDVQQAALERGGTNAQLYSGMQSFMQTLQAAVADDERAASSSSSGSSSMTSRPPVMCAVAALQSALEQLADAHKATALSVQPRQQDEKSHADATTDDLPRCMAQWRASALRLCNALDVQSGASLAVELMQLVHGIEQVAASSNDNVASLPWTQELRPGSILAALWRVLLETADVCAVTNATRCVALLAMSRLDAPDSSVLGEAVHATLMTRKPPPLQPPRTASAPSAAACGPSGGARDVCEVFWRTQVGARGVVDAARLARVKVRVLDVLLSLCDYDTCGRTLRNVDDYLTRLHRTSLYDLLVHLSRTDEEDSGSGGGGSGCVTAVVQVAALHLIGHYVVHVYPRVPLRRVCALCHDVFRLARLEMCKAACAAMLATTATALHAQDWLAALQDVDLAELHAVASAMSTYRSAPRRPSPSAAGAANVGNRPSSSMVAADAQEDAESCVVDELPHDEVVRRHGRDVLALLQELLKTTLVEEHKEAEEEASGIMRQLRIARPDIPASLRLT